MFCCFFALAFLSSCKDKATSTTDAKSEPLQEETTSATESDTASKSILFFGDSLTAGYGLDDTEDAYPALIQQKLDSMNLKYTAINAGVSGETTAGGKNRISWVLKQNVDIFVLELGANDGLRGIPISETRQNLQAIIDTVHTKNPDAQIVLAGMQLPPNLGEKYTTGFKQIFPELAEKNDAQLIPFLLTNVAGIPELNQQDGIHPTIKGQKIVAENVWDILAPMVKK
ncbi:MAG TPA: arylesterase [Leeuwenhoekiella sp.]|nr:arylesterase [Leeuwenhoekiella sp.]